MSTRRLALETRVLDGRANGEWRLWSLADFPNRFPGTNTEKAGEMAGKLFSAAATAEQRCLFLSGILVPPSPLALQVTGDVEWVDSRNMMSGYDLGAGLIGCESGIDERPREEGLFIASMPPPFSCNTDVMRELD
jgi:hypothetical protein